MRIIFLTIALGFLTTSGYANWLIEKGPQKDKIVVYWKMDKDGVKKGVLKNRKGSNKADIYGAKLTPEGLEFDGKDDYVDCGNPPELNFDVKNFTISFRIKFPDLAYGALFEKKERDNARKALIAFSEGKPYFMCLNQTKPVRYYAYMVGRTFMEPDTWYHIICVADREKNYPLIYVNGVLENKFSGTRGNFNKDLSSEGNAFLGKRNHRGKSTYFCGTIAEVCVWKDVALTEEEIKVIYSHGKKR